MWERILIAVAIRLAEKAFNYIVKKRGIKEATVNMAKIVQKKEKRA